MIQDNKQKKFFFSSVKLFFSPPVIHHLNVVKHSSFFIQTTSTPSAQEPMEEDQDYSEVMNNPEFLQHLVGSLPGVDPNSAAIQNALQALTGNQDDDNKNDKDDKKEDGNKS